MQETIRTEAIEAPGLAPDPRLRRRRTPMARVFTSVAILLLVAGLVAHLVAQQRALDHQAGILEAVRREQAELAERADGIEGVQSEATTRLAAVLDTETVVETTEGSVFTLLAGPWQGSAFVISSTGGRSTLITNFHVVRTLWAAHVRRVVIRDGRRSFNASIQAVRPGADLAIIDVPSAMTPLEPRLGPVDVGQPVVVVGSPYGYGGSVTTGVVSAVRGKVLQFSAPVSPGSSGGPVLDADGAVIGVAAAKVEARGAEGLSFAIPIGQVCRLTSAC